MWMSFGFGALGLLIGTLVGLTATSVVSALLPLVFALMGGSAIVVLNKLTGEERELAGKMLLAFGLCCSFGVYSAIFVAEHKYLSPRHQPDQMEATRTRQPAAEDQSKASGDHLPNNKYLRALPTTEADDIDTLFRNHVLTADQAYRKLYDVVTASQTATQDDPNVRK